MLLLLENNSIPIYKCNTFIKRFKGLMFLKQQITYGLCFDKCNAIHTFFMYQPFDLVITDKNHKIIYLKEHVTAWKIIGPIKKGYYTYELPLHSITSLHIGEQLPIKW